MLKPDAATDAKELVAAGKQEVPVQQRRRPQYRAGDPQSLHGTSSSSV
jgi:hypothetical protein